MDRIPIYKIINPYLLKIINIKYIDNTYITLDIIDYFYYFYNKDYDFINNSVIKNIKTLFKQNNSYLECITINIDNLFKNTEKELSEIEQLKVNEYIINYQNEILRINDIYNFSKIIMIIITKENIKKHIYLN